VAIDYLHRLIIEGPPDDVREFRRHMHREYPRTIDGKTWTEFVPFSFAALYEMAPAVRRIERELPCDPYELSAWPVRRIARGQAEVRYQFQTRNLEMAGFLRVLSRARPSLTFTLVTLCFDDSNIESYRLARGTTRRWVVPGRRQEFHWNRARARFELAGDEVYEDDDAEHWAEEEMLAEALTHWDAAAGAGRTRRRYRWWNQPPLRDLTMERELAAYEVADALASKEAPRTPSVASAGVRRRKGGRGSGS
jgi:hypothetical protein